MFNYYLGFFFPPLRKNKIRGEISFKVFNHLKIKNKKKKMKYNVIIITIKIFMLLVGILYLISPWLSLDYIILISTIILGNFWPFIKIWIRSKCIMELDLEEVSFERDLERHFERILEAYDESKEVIEDSLQPQVKSLEPPVKSEVKSLEPQVKSEVKSLEPQVKSLEAPVKSLEPVNDLECFVKSDEKSLHIAFNIHQVIDDHLLKSISKKVYNTIRLNSWFAFSKPYYVIFRISSMKSGTITLGKAMEFRPKDLNEKTIYNHIIDPFNILAINDFYKIEYPVIIYLKFVYNVIEKKEKKKIKNK